MILFRCLKFNCLEIVSRHKSLNWKQLLKYVKLESQRQFLCWEYPITEWASWSSSNQSIRKSRCGQLWTGHCSENISNPMFNLERKCESQEIVLKGQDCIYHSWPSIQNEALSKVCPEDWSHHHEDKPREMISKKQLI